MCSVWLEVLKAAHLQICDVLLLKKQLCSLSLFLWGANARYLQKMCLLGCISDNKIYAAISMQWHMVMMCSKLPCQAENNTHSKCLVLKLIAALKPEVFEK